MLGSKSNGTGAAVSLLDFDSGWGVVGYGEKGVDESSLNFGQNNQTTFITLSHYIFI